MPRSRRFARIARPLVHFALGGVALFAADLAWRALDRPAGTAEPIVIGAARLEQLREEHARRYGTPATDEELQALVDAEVADELLYREALARRLDRDDPSVRWRVLQKMRFLSDGGDATDADLIRDGLALGLDRDDVVVRRILAQRMRLLAQQPAWSEPIDDEALRAAFAAHRELYRDPPRVSLAHVFLARERRGAALEEDARRLLDELGRSEVGPDEATRLGDPFPLGRRIRAQSEAQLARLYGTEFAARVMALEPGRWAGPVPSAYGLHLVFVEEKRPARDPPLDEVRMQVEQRLRAEHGEQRVADLVRSLRERYDVRIEPAAEAASGDATAAVRR